MNKCFKILGIIALTAIIVLGMASCGGDKSDLFTGEWVSEADDSGLARAIEAKGKDFIMYNVVLGIYDATFRGTYELDDKKVTLTITGENISEDIAEEDWEDWDEEDFETKIGNINEDKFTLESVIYTKQE